MIFRQKCLTAYCLRNAEVEGSILFVSIPNPSTIQRDVPAKQALSRVRGIIFRPSVRESLSAEDIKAGGSLWDFVGFRENLRGIERNLIDRGTVKR